jgi:hypothetical protein
MNSFFYSSSYSEYKDGNLIDNSEESINYNNNKGSYTKSKFGKQLEHKKITKNDIDRYITINSPGNYITNAIFNDALAILNNNPYTMISPIYLGLNDKPTQKNKINNTEKVVKKNSKCGLIKKKYNLSTKDSKEQMRKVYKKKALETHPDKCKKKKCEQEFKELNNDYHFYFDKDNNC